MNLMRKVSKMGECPSLHSRSSHFVFIAHPSSSLSRHLLALHGHVRCVYAVFQSGPSEWPFRVALQGGPWSKVWCQVISNVDVIQSPFHRIQYSYIGLLKNIANCADLKPLIESDRLLVLLADPLCSRARESNL